MLYLLVLYFCVSLFICQKWFQLVLLVSLLISYIVNVFLKMVYEAPSSIHLNLKGYYYFVGEWVRESGWFWRSSLSQMVIWWNTCRPTTVMRGYPYSTCDINMYATLWARRAKKEMSFKRHWSWFSVKLREACSSLELLSGKKKS